MSLSIAEIQEITRSHRCAVCGCPLIAPWAGDHHAIRCLLNKTHQGTTPKRQTKTIAGREFDMTTQREIVPMPKTPDGMIARIKEAEGISLWPQKMTGAQTVVLAHVALAYGLDPFMREIMPYQGYPYITIAGRRRKDDEAGRIASITFRPLTAAEVEWYKEGEAYEDGDLVGFCVLSYRAKDGQGITVEGFGKVTKREREAMRTYRDGPRKGQQYQASPVVANNPVELFQKRAERRAREMAWGPIVRPNGLPGSVRVIEDGDIIEGAWKDVEEPALEQPSEQDAPNENESAHPKNESAHPKNESAHPKNESAPTTDTDVSDLFPHEDTTCPVGFIGTFQSFPGVPDGFKAVVDKAGEHGLDLVAFCENVLPARCHTLDAFMKIGGTPEAAEKRLTEWVAKQ